MIITSKVKVPVFLLSVIFFVTAVPSISQAQQDQSNEGLLDALEQIFKRDYLSISTLIQAQGEFHMDPQFQGENTFRIPTARIKLSGNLDRNVSYTIQTDFTNSPALLDANVTYSFSDMVSITAGAQKPGLSGEYLTGAANTDFINRSRIVNLLAGSRDIGVLGKVELTDGLQLSGGMFNGTNQNLGNNSNEFYYTGRIEANNAVGSNAHIVLAGNASYGNENGTSIGNGVLPAINGQRAIIGGDGRLEVGNLLLSGEFLYGELEYGPTQADNIMGFHATAGYWVIEDLQFIARFDHVQSDLVPFAENIVVGGLNYNYTDAASFQLNYQVNPDQADFANHFVLLQTQIAF
ncbi:MAG: porin [Balneolaceae bacterium]|nr:porin [Balneolaceae bacterium]